MKKDSQHYSKIALKYIQEKIAKGEVYNNYVCYGNLDMMEDLFRLFGGDPAKELEKSTCPHNYIQRKFGYVMNRLDRESKKPDAILEKRYICYNGIINRPTRCFRPKENNNDNKESNN